MTRRSPQRWRHAWPVSILPPPCKPLVGLIRSRRGVHCDQPKRYPGARRVGRYGRSGRKTIHLHGRRGNDIQRTRIKDLGGIVQRPSKQRKLTRAFRIPDSFFGVSNFDSMRLEVQIHPISGIRGLLLLTCNSRASKCVCDLL